MASSSSSSSSNMIPGNKYEVFLSFRGEDTRHNFTSHLYAALRREQIETFFDDQLNRGDEISQSLLNAIEGSHISIVIFSERYASSGWCLDELVNILECKNMYGQTVIPVFYRVDPSHVRNQTGIFGDSFSKLEERFPGRLDKLQKWRIALREAANLSGFDSLVVRSESVLIEIIVEDILKRLNDMFPNDPNKDLVGVESRIKEIESVLSYESIKVNKLGIWGIGGIGKTTIAGAIVRKISRHFDGSYFVQNVREESEKTGGLTHLRRELLSSLNIEIPKFSLNFESKGLGRKKVLIVFDDVTRYGQIESLIGSLDRFKPGSLIVITTRNKQVLRNCGVERIYEMKELLNDDALKLLSRHAFGRDCVNSSYVELSNRVMEYAKGVPLALKVLGCHLSGRRKEEWESAINKLKRIPHVRIMEVLKISYDGLDDEEKNIFLNIACFFKGERIDLVTKCLDASGFSAKIGIRVLVDKGLIVISNEKIEMHDLLQEMGKEIVRQESVDDPRKCSRLWDPEDIYEVLTYNIGTEAIQCQCICLDMAKIEEINFDFDTFRKMRKLRFLKFYGVNKIQICEFGESECIWTKLSYLHWDGYPLKLLPSSMRTENLVLLKLSNSQVHQLWDGVQNLVNLKQMDVRFSKHLTKLPDLSKAQKLEMLNLGWCTSLTETHSSIQYLNKLVILNLRYCISLKSLPRCIHSECLEELHLSACSNLKRFPEISSCNLQGLFLNGTAMEELPSFIEYQSRLVTLSVADCSRLESLPNGLCKLKSLEYLTLSGCSNLKRLPDELGNLQALKSLQVRGTAVREVPSSIVCLNNLETADFSGFKGDHENMDRSFIFFDSLPGLHSLTNLSLTDCGITELPESLGQLSSLAILFLDNNNFERIPESIINLSKLFALHLGNCRGLLSLPKLPSSLRYLIADHCTSLETLSDLSLRPLDFIPDQWNFRFWDCFKLDGNEVRRNFEEALQKIQLVPTQLIPTLTLPEEELERYQEFCYLDGCISYPGSEIPEWFMYRSTGSSITLELPPGDREIVGFGFCMIFAFEEHYSSDLDFWLYFEFKSKTEDGDLHFSSSDDPFPFGFEPIDYYVGSDHIVLGYRRNVFGYNNEVLIQFHLRAMRGKDVDYYKAVRKCGIHLLYGTEGHATRKRNNTHSTPKD